MTRQVVIDTKLMDKIIAATRQPVREHIIADGVDYGLYVELGTSRMSAQPFLIPAFEKHVKPLPKALGMAIEGGVPLDDVLSKVAFDIQGGAQQRAPVDTGALKNSLHTETR